MGEKLANIREALEWELLNIATTPGARTIRIVKCERLIMMIKTIRMLSCRPAEAGEDYGYPVMGLKEAKGFVLAAQARPQPIPDCLRDKLDELMAAAIECEAVIELE